MENSNPTNSTPPADSNPTPSAPPQATTVSPPATYIDHDAPSHSSKVKLLIGVFVVMILLAAGAYYYLTVMQAPATTSTVVPTPAPVAQQPEVKPASTLTIDSPADNTVVKTDQLTVKGKAPANATVVVYTENRQASGEADASGNYEINITLSPGINTLTVNSFDDKGDEKTATKTVTYDNQS